MKPILIIAFMALALSSVSGQERFFELKDPNRVKKFTPRETVPGTLVAADEKGILTLDNTTVTIHGQIYPFAANEALNALSRWKNDVDSVEWNVDIPRDGEYFVDLSWTAGKDSGEGTLHFICGEEKLDWKRPIGLNWDHTLAGRMGKMSLKQGKAVFELKRTSQEHPEKGIANIVFIKLVPVGENHAQKVQEISAKSLVELTSRERNLIWGTCSKVPTLQLNKSGVEKRLTEQKMLSSKGMPNEDSILPKYYSIGSRATQERHYADGTFYTATLYNQRCIALDIAREKMTSKEALELVKKILPKSRFKITRKEANTNRFSLNSQDRDNSYDLEYWNDNGLCHLSIHNQKLVMDQIPIKTTRLKGCIDSMYKAIAQNALKANKKDLFKNNWMDLTDKEWEILMGGPSAGSSRVLKPAVEAEEWIFDTLSLKVQFDKNGRVSCFAISTPFPIFPRDMVSLASKLFPTLFIESPDSTLLNYSEYTLKADGPKGKKYQCTACRYNDVTEFAITPVSAGSVNQQ